MLHTEIEANRQELLSCSDPQISDRYATGARVSLCYGAVRKGTVIPEGRHPLLMMRTILVEDRYLTSENWKQEWFADEIKSTACAPWIKRLFEEGNLEMLL